MTIKMTDKLEKLMRLKKEHITQFINDIIALVNANESWVAVIKNAQTYARYMHFFTDEPKLHDFCFANNPVHTELGYTIYQYADSDSAERLSQPAFRSAVESIFGF